MLHWRRRHNIKKDGQPSSPEGQQKNAYQEELRVQVIPFGSIGIPGMPHYISVEKQ